MKVKFSPPDIIQEDINEVIDTLKSGWITTGPKTKKFEDEISHFCGTERTVCLNSATAGLELILRLLEVGQDDEIITTAYTYTASASVINHVGAKIVLVDISKDSYNMDLEKLQLAITPKTKAIIAVDLGGVISNYEEIIEVANRNKNKFCGTNKFQQAIGRIAVIADGAHSFGASQKGKMSGNIADFTSFSFHAVKNLTTGEGGAVTWRQITGLDSTEIYNVLMRMSLHGQTKDAFSKAKLGGWEYDIISLGYKCNMTDIMASLGISQLSRYEKTLKRREEISNFYNRELKKLNVSILCHRGENFKSSHHLYLVRLNNKHEEERNSFIAKMAEAGIATNVHYKPLPMMTAYKKLGYDIENYPNAFNMYENEITLPLNTTMTNEEVEFVVLKFIEIYNEMFVSGFNIGL